MSNKPLPTTSQQLDTIILRPQWCELGEYCIPLKRFYENSDVDGCTGVSRGRALGAHGDEDTLYARHCWHTAGSEEPASLALDFVDCAEFLAAMSLAHEEQIKRIFVDPEDEEDASNE